MSGRPRSARKGATRVRDGVVRERATIPTESYRMQAGSLQVVLVHGAWHGGWSWGEVPSLLEARGFDVTVIDRLPSSRPGVPQGLAADADALREVVATATKPVVLVAHSYGGMVISELAGDPRIAAAVYVAAFLPGNGGKVFDLLSGELPPWFLVDSESGFCSVAPEFAGHLMASNAPSDAAREEHVRRMGPHALTAFVDPSSTSGWGDVPVSYLVAGRDEIIPPEAQVAMAEAAGATMSRIDTPHFPTLSESAAVVDLIAATAERA